MEESESAVRGFEGRVDIVENDQLVAVVAVDRQALLDLLDEIRGLQLERARDIIGFTVKMPCGYKQEFKLHSDIPLEDLPCSCGRDDHYLIKYEGVKENGRND